MTITIKAQQLTKRYPSQDPEAPPALDGIDLEIEAGRLYGLVGPDGAGKTTLLRILSTVLKPTSGSASMSGFDIVKQTEQVRARLGYMPQSFSLYPDLSVIENLRFFADINGVPRRKQNERIETLLEFARLTDFTTRRSMNLSGGMRKKLALTCAMIHEPEILVLDEPTTGVDPVSRRELWELLARVIDRGFTVLLSTPYMAEASLLQAQSALNLIDVQLEKTVVNTPMDGYVLAQNLEVGEMLSPGGVVMVIGKLEELELTVYIPVTEYGQVRLGDEVSIEVDSFPGTSFTGTITYISDQAEFTPRNVQTIEGRQSTVYAIKVTVPNPDLRLKPGMPADVTFGE